MICDYCKKPAQCVGGNVVYPHRPDLSHKRIWRCVPCDAYVGCHGSSQTPLGRLANAELRQWRKKAHAAFDPLWRTGKMDRKKAYSWLARTLGLNESQAHIGMFDVELCKRVIQKVHYGDQLTLF